MSMFSLFPKKFEKINKDLYTDRLKVHNGWLVRTMVYTRSNGAWSIHTIFIEDPQHAWIIEDEEKL